MGKPMKTGWFGQTPYIPEKEPDIYDVGTLPELVITPQSNPTFYTKKGHNYALGPYAVRTDTYIDPRYDSTKKQLRVPYNQPTDTPNDVIYEILAAQKEPSLEKSVSYEFEPERSSEKVILETPTNDAETFIVKRVPDTSETSIEELAKQVINGKFGNGSSRKKALGDKYNDVQKIVNSKMGSKRNHKTILIPAVELKYLPIEPGHELPTEPLNIPQYLIDKHYEQTKTPLNGAQISAIFMDPFNLHTMSEEEADKILEESPKERRLTRRSKKKK